MTSREVALRKDTVVPVARMTRRKPLRRLKDAALLIRDLTQIDERYLLPVVGHEERFKPAIDTRWLWNLNLNTWTAILSVGVSDVIGTAVTFAAIGTTEPAALSIAAPILAATQIAWLPVGVAYSKLRRGRRRNFNAFLLWLLGRYGISLDSKQGLPKHISSSTARWRKEFKDDRGRRLKLVEDRFGSYRVCEVDGDGELPHLGAAAASSAAKVASKASEVRLPRELAALLSKIEEHLSVLSSRALSPESDHVVNRAARDREKVVTLYADLVRLGVSKFSTEQEVAIKRTFTTLMSELKGVLDRETTFALQALSIENNYVAAREERVGIKLRRD